VTHPGEETSICIGCGLCCDGKLHATATVRPEDEVAVQSAGLVIADDGTRRFFRQPCAQFSCGACSVYATRPQVCRNYRCALLIRVESGEISRSAARDKISTAMGLRGSVKKIDPHAVTPAQRSSLSDRLRNEMRQSADEARERTAKALLACAALEHFLNRWFIKEEKRR
jgi:uncharacterized protein